jgi:hypothetical protein
MRLKKLYIVSGMRTKLKRRSSILYNGKGLRTKKNIIAEYFDNWVEMDYLRKFYMKCPRKLKDDQLDSI